MADFLVAGAGISGLHAALLLARRGQRVRVIERAARAGGLAGAERFRGIPCDLGSHRLHPDALLRPLFREIHRDAPFLDRPRRGVLIVGGRRIPYPPGALSLLGALGPRTSLHFALGLAVSATRRAAFARWEQDREDGANDVGFERFICQRVGEAAYRAFYKPYAEKVWGLPPAELSQAVAKKRVSTTRPLRLIRGLLGRAPERFVYPPGGAGSLIAWLEARLAEHFVSVQPATPFQHDPGGPTTLFAGDLSDLVPTALGHRGLYLVYLALPLGRVSEVETYYTPDPRYWFGRVSELQNYSPSLRRPGETVLCVEIPEGAWGQGVDFASGARLAELLDQLADAGIVPPGARPIEVRQRFVPRVYPLYRRGFRQEWRATMERVAALGNVFPFGRQALFLHVNLDHCADIAEDVVAHVLSGGDVRGWIGKAERYLDLRVRD
jgi:hypothetical protein